jgi:hypothetical protein
MEEGWEGQEGFDGDEGFVGEEGWHGWHGFYGGGGSERKGWKWRCGEGVRGGVYCRCQYSCVGLLARRDRCA